MITIPSYMLYEAIPCPIEYLLKKYGHHDIFPIAKPIKLSRNTFVFLIPSSMSDNFIELLQEDELCTIDHIENEEFVNMNFTNKCIAIKSRWLHNDYVADYFIVSDDTAISNDSTMETTLEIS
jgi:hypothetical protein